MATQILRRADVRVLDTAGTRADALAWRDGTIVAVGADSDVTRIAGPDATVVDLGGRAVLPGFIDAHHHPCIVALYGSALRLSSPTVTDIPSLQRALAARAATTAPGAWIVASDWDEHTLRERRPPTRAELDDAAPEHPVFALHYTCHRALANSRALALAGIDAATADPSGGEIARGRGGAPNGLLLERAMSPVERLARADLVARDADGFLERLGAHHRALAAAGITRVADATVPRDLFTLYRAAAAGGYLVVPTVLMPVSTQGYLEAPWDVLDDARDTFDGALLEAGPVKLVFDGAPGCAMCLGWLQSAGAMLDAFALTVRQGSLDAMRTSMELAPRLGVKIRTGIQIYRHEEARAIVAAAVERGFAVATHAIGNEAVSIALDAYEAARGRLDAAGRPRLEHATFLDAALVRRIADVGAAVVANPNFMTLPTYASAASIPGIRNSPLRWLLDAKALVCGSSDFPVAGFAPLAGIAAAVTRRTRDGRVYEPDQRVTVDEALALYTRSAAEALGQLARCGTLEVGKRADLVVLDGALDTADAIAAATVRATVIDGALVHGAL